MSEFMSGVQIQWPVTYLVHGKKGFTKEWCQWWWIVLFFIHERKHRLHAVGASSTAFKSKKKRKKRKHRSSASNFLYYESQGLFLATKHSFSYRWLVWRDECGGKSFFFAHCPCSHCDAMNVGKKPFLCSLTHCPYSHCLHDFDGLLPLRTNLSTRLNFLDLLDTCQNFTASTKIYAAYPKWELRIRNSFLWKVYLYHRISLYMHITWTLCLISELIKPILKQATAAYIGYLLKIVVGIFLGCLLIMYVSEF